MTVEQQDYQVFSVQTDSWVESINHAARAISERMEPDASVLLVKDANGTAAAILAEGPEVFALLMAGIVAASTEIGMPTHEYIDQLKASYLKDIAKPENLTVH